MKREIVQIKIDEMGNHTFEAKEGFSGSSCMERTKTLELALGGVAVENKKTDDFYKPNDDSPLRVKL